MANWRKFVLSGSDAEIATLSVDNSITGSIFSGSQFSGSFSGSFQGDGSLLTGIPTGPQGGQGVQGPTGADSNVQGGQGIQGIQGIQGNIGPASNVQGGQGIQGPTGADSNVQGGQGVQGPTGNTGATGPTGGQGIQGVQGGQGTSGESITGAQGGQGIQGIQGGIGVGTQGIQGPASNVQGGQGIQGPNGPASNVQGGQGIQGPNGPASNVQGGQGIQGPTGADSNVQGGQGIQGPNGPSSNIVGPTGVQGIQGIQGIQGSTGKTGLSYTYSTSTDMAGAAGQIRFNNSTIGSSTQISIALQDANGATHNNLFSANSQLLIYGASTGDIITVTSYTINTINGTRALLDVSSANVEQNGTFSNSEAVLVQYVKNGGNGAQGGQGVQGRIGIQGNQGTAGSQGVTGTFAGSNVLIGNAANSSTTGSNEFQRANITGGNAISIIGSLNVANVGASITTIGMISATNDVIAFASSDENYKENIKPISNPIEKINQIDGVEFDWKPLTEEEVTYHHSHVGHDIGVIAQQIEKILPEIVTTRDNGFKAVKYEKIIP